ncbi:Golgi apparatus protein 1-like [Macrosteles quadrilineatus]|uniref:Golgi apparatus protein 1-like n=1 Tax=Macrosteles quadrilineatus TaxID=74068 RepID=UPI0023E2A771|nr:Golgi apparatus protein 1-like [Macrosteles quadrilineatus]
MSYYHFYSVLCLLSIVLVTVTSSSTNLSPVFWIPSGQSHNRVVRSPYTTHSTLLSNIKCKDDLRRLCPNLNSNNDDLTVLECIQTAKGDAIATISKDCHHELWTVTNNLMNNDQLKIIITPACQSDWKSEWDKGNLLINVLDNVNNIKSPECRILLQRIGLVAFSDFRIIGHFTNSCEEDIQRFQCGRIGLDKMMLSQGLTLMCLQQHLEDGLAAECKTQVLHLSQVQADNIKFDRQLYLACNVELNKFCPTVTIGLGQAYECLMQHKFDTLISQPCQDQLLRHQKIIVQDFSVSKGLARACKEDIRNYRCRRLVSDDKGVRLAQILLCLENAIKNGSKVAWDCHKEMVEHRRMLLEDFRLSPEIVSHCSNDIAEYCNGLEAGGRTIHCLMDHSRPKRRKERVSPPCLRALEDLVEKTDIGEDWRVDPYLKEACKPVVDKTCQDVRGGDARVINCLMEKLGSPVMTEDCEEALLQIQYFVSRDYRLDPQLFRACHAEAVKLCHARRAWHSETSMNPDSGPLVLPCLFRYIYYSEDKHYTLSTKCSDEVRRVMRQRAMSVELQPEVEYECLNDLARYCIHEQEPAKGEEMLCLQDHMESLEENCKKVIHNFTEIQSENLELNPLIMTHCRAIMSHHCEAELQSANAGDMMECLIEHKNEPDVRSNYKCRSSIEHHQLISLSDYHFTVKFKEACRIHVARYCPSARTKAKVVECLSEIVRNDTISDSRHRVPRDCRQQLKTQLLQQRENIDLDPKLREMCGSDIEKLCGHVKHENAQVLECLEEKKKNLSASCHRRIFNIELQDFTDSSTDYTLLTSCKPMMRLYCQQYDKSQALSCLKKHKDEGGFDSKCRLVVMRRMIEQSTDYRFNPLLAVGCRMDIDKFCHAVVDHQPRDQELQGKVIKCLKAKFREGKLRNECEAQMANVLREAALDYKLNPLLKTLCQDEINKLCYDKDDGKGGTEECLKVALLRGHISSRACKLEVAGLIEEAKADIHVDPLLHKACSLDLNKFCFDVEQGAGRQIQCLLNVMAQHKYLQSECEKMLHQRMEMFKNADAQIGAQPQNVGDLIVQVSNSPSRRYFILVTLTFVGMVFIIGMFFGRVTRRTIMKNK